MTYVALRVTFDSTALGENLKGYDTVPIFINPLFGSRTPTEFWTKRWNTMIYTNLKASMCGYRGGCVCECVSECLCLCRSGQWHFFV
jgi:hypothetical protein